MNNFGPTIRTTTRTIRAGRSTIIAEEFQRGSFLSQGYLDIYHI
jgi:hypothetical protein